MEDQKYLVELLELATKLNSDFQRAHPNDASSWMKSASYFLNVCFEGGYLNESLKNHYTLAEQQLLIEHLQQLKTYSSVYSPSNKALVTNALSFTIKSLNLKIGNKSRPNSSFSSVLSISNKPSDIQNSVLEAAWEYWVSFGKPYPIRSLTPLIGKLSHNEAIGSLSTSLLYSTTDSDGESIKLTMHGALLTKNGPALWSLIVILLDYVKRVCAADTTIKNISNFEIQSGLGLSVQDSLRIFRLLALGSVNGLPFHLSSYDPDGSSWNIAIRDTVHELIRSEDSSEYLYASLKSEYKAKTYAQSKSDFKLIPTIFENHDSSTQTSNGTTKRKKTAPSKSKRKQVPQKDDLQISALSALPANRSESEAELDLLGRESLTQALYSLLTKREDKHPFAIGLFGHWGSGKSSQVNFLKDELKKSGSHKIRFADFNAWENEKATNIAAILAQAVVDGLVADKGMCARISLAVRLKSMGHFKTRQAVDQDWLAFFTRWLWVLPQFILPLSLIAFLIVKLAINAGFFGIIFSFLGFVSVLMLGALHFVSGHLTELFKRIDFKSPLSFFSLPSYSAQRGLILDVHRTLKDICTLCLKDEESSLLLVIDDLDRCGVDTVKEVLDAIRLVANIPRVVTVVAIDERMAFAAVEKHYQQFGHAGIAPELVARDYLAKVLQVSVTLPAMDEERINSYVDKKIFHDIGSLNSVNEILNNSYDENAGSPKNEIKRDLLSDQMSSAVSSSDPISSVESGATSTNSPKPQSALPAEKELFKELAHDYGFSNPRLLWRLYMAWKLLKSLTLKPSYKFEDMQFLLHLLFWREWLHQLTSDESDKFSLWITESDSISPSAPENMPDEIFIAVSENLCSKWKDNSHFIKLVDAVLLPSSPRNKSGSYTT